MSKKRQLRKRPLQVIRIICPHCKTPNSATLGANVRDASIKCSFAPCGKGIRVVKETAGLGPSEIK